MQGKKEIIRSSYRWHGAKFLIKKIISTLQLKKMKILNCEINSNRRDKSKEEDKQQRERVKVVVVVLVVYEEKGKKRLREADVDVGDKCSGADGGGGLRK